MIIFSFVYDCLMEDEFEPSCLGTKEHWDCAYEAELLNFVSSQEEGEIWFGEKVQNETVNYIVKHIEDRSTCIMDIGCGNGMFLIQLASKGSFSNLKGFDYSQKAVQLARSVAENRQATAVDFFLGDFLSDEFDHKCQIAIDKVCISGRSFFSLKASWKCWVSCWSAWQM